MKKVPSLISHLVKSALEELRILRRDFRKYFPLFHKLIPDESAEELDWNVEDPYAESMFKQIRSAETTK